MKMFNFIIKCMNVSINEYAHTDDSIEENSMPELLNQVEIQIDEIFNNNYNNNYNNNNNILNLKSPSNIIKSLLYTMNNNNNPSQPDNNNIIREYKSLINELKEENAVGVNIIESLEELSENKLNRNHKKNLNPQIKCISSIFIKTYIPAYEKIDIKSIYEYEITKHISILEKYQNHLNKKINPCKYLIENFCGCMCFIITIIGIMYLICSIK